MSFSKQLNGLSAVYDLDAGGNHWVAIERPLE